MGGCTGFKILPGFPVCRILQCQTVTTTGREQVKSTCAIDERRRYVGQVAPRRVEVPSFDRPLGKTAVGRDLAKGVAGNSRYGDCSSRFNRTGCDEQGRF